MAIQPLLLLARSLKGAKGAPARCKARALTHAPWALLLPLPMLLLLATARMQPLQQLSSLQLPLLQALTPTSCFPALSVY